MVVPHEYSFPTAIWRPSRQIAVGRESFFFEYLGLHQPRCRSLVHPRLPAATAPRLFDVTDKPVAISWTRSTCSVDSPVNLDPAGEAALSPGQALAPKIGETPRTSFQLS